MSILVRLRRALLTQTHRSPAHAFAAAVGQLHLAIATGLLVWALVILHPEPALMAMCAAMIAMIAGLAADEGRAE